MSVVLDAALWIVLTGVCVSISAFYEAIQNTTGRPTLTMKFSEQIVSILKQLLYLRPIIRLMNIHVHQSNVTGA